MSGKLPRLCRWGLHVWRRGPVDAVGHQSYVCGRCGQIGLSP